MEQADGHDLLPDAAERLKLAVEASAILGTWYWDVPRDRFIADARFAMAFGLDPVACSGGLPMTEVAAPIHPDDWPAVEAAVNRALENGGPYRCTYRVRRLDGGYRWVEASGSVELDAHGRPLRFPGLLFDVEARVQAESARDRADALLRTFIEAVPGVVYAKDREGRLVVANRGVAELVGKPQAELIGHTDLEFLADKDQARQVMATDARIMRTGVAEQLEEAVRLADGSMAWWLSSKSPLCDENGRVIGLVGSSVDITERRQQRELARIEAEMLELLNRTGTALAAELDLDALLQQVTDAATTLTGARFGAFLYNGVDERGEAYSLFTISGAPREAFERFGHPRPTPLFNITFRGGPPVRIGNVRQDPRYGHWGPHHGMPEGHLPVSSYLAVPVVSRSGEVIGGLFFGHPEPDVFSERAERLAVGIAAHAAVAVDNARLYAAVQQAAEDRNRLLESERAARADAERASAIKDEFLATVSHELRTPLNAILGWGHILQRTANGDASVAKASEVIQRAARAQAQLIDDLLDMSRITSGKLRLERRVVDPSEVVRAAVEAARPSADAAGVSIQVTGGGKPVLGDPARLQQVVWNLLSNAVKFSRRGDLVEVSVDADETWCRIQVRDRGAGIAPEFLGLIFERFRQADGSSTRQFGGLGLGLSIVRHIVEAHGGRVTVHSEGIGKGACFTVLLPHPAREQVPDNGQAPKEARLDGCLVLVVDDMDDARELMVRVLQDAGASVRAAADAASALREFDACRPDAVVSDVSMPGMDGFELARRIRRLPPDRGGQVPLLALTAFTRPTDRLLALQSGFSRHLPKPLEPLQLVHELAQLLERQPA